MGFTLLLTRFRLTPGDATVMDHLVVRGTALVTVTLAMWSLASLMGRIPRLDRPRRAGAVPVGDRRGAAAGAAVQEQREHAGLLRAIDLPLVCADRRRELCAGGGNGCAGLCGRGGAAVAPRPPMGFLTGRCPDPATPSTSPSSLRTRLREVLRHAQGERRNPSPLVSDAHQSRELQVVEVGEGDVPLHSHAGCVLGLEAADALCDEAAGRGEAGDGALAVLEGVDGGAVRRRADALVVLDVVADADGDAVVVVEHLAELVAVGDKEAAVGGAGEGVELASGASEHQEHVGLALDDLVDELVELVEGEGCAVRAHGNGLGGGDELVDAVECLGVGGRVAVDEGVLELGADGIGLELDDGGLEVLDVGAGRLEVVVDIGVAAEDLEAGGDLGEGGGRLGPGVADGVEGRSGCGVLLVVGQAVADYLYEGQGLQDGAFLDDGLYDAGQEQVIGELCALHKGQGHGVSSPRSAGVFRRGRCV